MSFLSSLFRRKLDLKKDIAGMRLIPAWFSIARPDAQFLISYPRSGNRWVRTMLLDLLTANLTGDDSPLPLAALLPDMHFPPNADQLSTFPSYPLHILKSHNIRELADRRMVYLFRQATDTLVSQFHFRKRVSHWQKPLEAMGVDTFCKEMVASWADHVRLGLQAHTARPAEVLMISYEGLQAAPNVQLGRLAKFLGCPATNESIEHAVQQNTFQKSRERVIDLPPGREKPMLRKGIVNSSAAELLPETYAGLLEATRTLYAEAAACTG